MCRWKSGWFFEADLREERPLEPIRVQMRALLRGEHCSSICSVPCRCSAGALRFLFCGGASGSGSRGGEAHGRWWSRSPELLRQGGVAGTVDGRGATGHSGASCPTAVSPSGSAESATYSVGKFEGRSSASTTYMGSSGASPKFKAQSRFPLLDAGVVNAALQAGVPESNLIEMQRHFGKLRAVFGPPRRSVPGFGEAHVRRPQFSDIGSGPTTDIGLNARAWVEFHSKIGNYNKTSAHASWGAAGVLAMEPWSRQSCRWRAFLPSVLWRCINHLQWQTASSRSAASYIDSEVCRDIAGVPEGPGRLPGKKKECQEVQCAEDQGWRWKRGSRSQKDGQSEGQVQRGRPKLAASRISFRPHSGRWESDSWWLAGAFDFSLFRALYSQDSFVSEFIAPLVAANPLQPSDFFAIHLDDPWSPCRFNIHVEIYLADASSVPWGVSQWRCWGCYTHVKRLVCLQIVVFERFTLVCPAMCPNTLRLGRKLSSRQWSQLFAGLKIPFWMATPHNSSSAADMGRSAAKNKDYEDALAALCRAASMVHVFDYGASRASRPRRFDDSWLRSGSLVGWHSLYWWLIASRFLTHLCLTLWSTLMTAQGGGMSFLSAVDYLLPKWAHLLDVWTMPPLLRDCCYSRSFVRLEWLNWCRLDLSHRVLRTECLQMPPGIDWFWTAEPRICSTLVRAYGASLWPLLQFLATSRSMTLRFCWQVEKIWKTISISSRWISKEPAVTCCRWTWMWLRLSMSSADPLQGWNAHSMWGFLHWLWATSAQWSMPGAAMLHCASRTKFSHLRRWSHCLVLCQGKGPFESRHIVDDLVILEQVARSTFEQRSVKKSLQS